MKGGSGGQKVFQKISLVKSEDLETRIVKEEKNKQKKNP